MFNKEVFRALAVSVVVTILGIYVLAWQYDRLARERVPQLEREVEEQRTAIEEQREALEEQRSVLEQQRAHNALLLFLQARISNREDQTVQYMSENAMLQFTEGEYELFRELDDFEVIDVNRLGGEEFQFNVEMSSESDRFELLEIITIRKITDRYYIDSLEIAG